MLKRIKQLLGQDKTGRVGQMNKLADDIETKTIDAKACSSALDVIAIQKSREADIIALIRLIRKDKGYKTGLTASNDGVVKLVDFPAERKKAS